MSNAQLCDVTSCAQLPDLSLLVKSTQHSIKQHVLHVCDCCVASRNKCCKQSSAECVSIIMLVQCSVGVMLWLWSIDSCGTCNSL